MYTVTLESTGNGREVIAHIEETMRRLEEMRPLGVEIGMLMKEDVMEARAAGEDWDGQPLAELAESTLRDRRRAGGPPLAPYGNPPKYGQGRLSNGFSVEVLSSPGRVQIIGSWPEAPWIRFHSFGPDHSSRLPVRHIVGVRPVGYELIRQAVVDYLTFHNRI